MPSVTVAGSGSGLDTRDFRALTKALRRAAPQANRDLKRGLRKAGNVVTMEARIIAAASSETIPPTIRVRTSGASVTVQAGGGGVAIAALFELGNLGRGRRRVASRTGRFRHPVYGNRHRWVDQGMHPYLTPAAIHRAAEVERLVVAALDAAAHAIVHS